MAHVENVSETNFIILQNICEFWRKNIELIAILYTSRLAYTHVYAMNKLILGVLIIIYRPSSKEIRLVNLVNGKKFSLITFM